MSTTDQAAANAQLKESFSKTEGSYGGAEHMLVGDFNPKSPLWGGIHIHPSPGINNLYEITDMKNLQPLLPRGTIIRY